MTTHRTCTDNNDGISVIDVTDPTAPSYCFVSVSGIEAQKAVPECVPLSAEQYVRAYYPKCTPPVEAQSDEMEKKIEEDVQATIELLKDVKLVELAMLAEAWPAEYNLDGKMQNPADTPAKPVSADLPSLVELTMPLAVEQAIQTGEVKDIEAMIWIPEKASMIKAFLRQMSPFPDGGIELLKTLAEAEISTPNAELDLTGFTLSTSQLGNLLSSMKKTVDVVNLSQMSTLTIDDVRMVLRVPQLKRLILLDCPLVSSDDIHSLLRTEPSLFNQLEALIHPSLLSGLNDMDDSRPYHSAFSCIGMGFGTVEACSLPFFNLPHIIQALHDVLQPLRVNLSAQWSSLLMQAAFSSVRRPGQAWSERNTVIIPQFSLAGLRGEGWTFAFTVDFKGGSFAFLRLNSRRFITSDNEQAEAESDTASGSDETKELGWEIHDLASFIDQAVLDGKARPTDEAVNMLQDTLTGFQTSTGLQKQWMQLMNDDDVKQLIANARFRY